MIPKRTPAGGGVLPYKRLMVMCRWVGSHFNYWIDYNGVALSIELLKWIAHFKILGVRKFFIFIGTFSIRFFVGNGKPQTAKCHVTTALRSRLQFAVHV